MKKALIALAIVLCVAGTAFAQVKSGPIVDKVIYEVRMDQTLATKDIIEGKADVFFQAVPAAILRGLSETEKAKLDQYQVPSGSWSLMINPIPNKAPYTWTKKDGVTEFNPFAIKEVRYALNWLFDRKKMVDEILFGQGDPMFTPMTPGQPGTYRYNLIPAKLGMTDRGNEKRAIADIDAAMQAAAKLPENKGKLVKSGQFWQYNGKDVTIKFLIRVDDANGRLKAGRYMADQIEKAGIKVDRLERDRSAINIAYYSNPADLEFHLYTEGWGAGATRAWWDIVISQMYAPYYGYMAGGAEPDNWNYENAEIDRLGQKGLNGQFMTEEEYWADNLKGTELGITEACRIYLASQLDTFVANKDRFNSRMAYGLGDGLNGWSVRTADVKPETSGADKGLKVLRVLQYSARGTLFMSSWDPVGVDGFSDVYSMAIIEPCSDLVTFEAPNSAIDTALRGKYDSNKMEVKSELKGDEIVGLIDVPASAIMYDSATKTWKAVGAGVKSWSKGTVSYLYGKWHSGANIDFADIMYAGAFQQEWTFQDGPNDKYYDASYASTYEPTLAINKGFVVNRDNSITSYFNFQWPMDVKRVAATAATGADVKAGNTGRQTVVSWDVYEALALIVAEGSKSGTVYSFTGSDSVTEVDVVAEKSVADIKAKLQDMVAKQHVPVSIKQWVTPAQAVARYNTTLAFINKYGHAYVSNGPFFISKVNATTNSMELTAFRDYPYKSDYWPKAFRTTITKIENANIPATATRKNDLKIDVTVSTYVYPDTATTPATNKGKVTVAFQLPDGSEKVYQAKYTKPGVFTATIPAKEMGALKPGAYTVVIISSLAGEAPSVLPKTLVLF